MGLLSLRRRKETTTGDVVYEIKLDEDFLMSSMFTVAEVALANLGLAASPHAEMDVVVGGLGLGYTAVAALRHPQVRELLIVDALDGVIKWHEEGLRSREVTSTSASSPSPYPTAHQGPPGVQRQS